MEAADAVRVFGVIFTRGLCSREARNDSQRQVCFSTASSETFARPRECSYTSPRVRGQSGRLLQRTARERAENYD